MARFIKVAVVYCPVCNERVEKCNFWPGYLYVNKTLGRTFLSERGEVPPHDYMYEDQQPAPWADWTEVEPCGHRLTAEQAREMGDDMKRQLADQ